MSLSDERKCILCLSQKYVEVIEGEDRLSGQKGKFKVMRCSNCGLAYTWPRLNVKQLKSFYPSEYFGSRLKEKRSPKIQDIKGIKRSLGKYFSILLWKHLFLRPNFRQKLSYISQRIILFPFYKLRVLPYKDRPGKLLDVGCATGNFLDYQRLWGWDVYGVELSEKAASFARDVKGLKVKTGQLDDANYEESFFDIVNLSHTLEHFPNPFKELKKIRRILRKDGLIIITIPNCNKIEPTVFGSYWCAYDLPRHQLHLSPDAAKKLLEKGGFEVLKIIFTLNVSNLITSLKYVLEKRARHISRFFSVENRMLRILFFPVSAFLKLIKQSEEMIIYAKPY